MTNKDESQIKSFNVSAYSSEEKGFSDSFLGKKQCRPWVVLVCFDGGFNSEKPERITAASFNEFLEKSDAVISGTVKEGLPEDIEPFYIEYPIKDLKDFSPLAISCKIPLIKRLKNAMDLLDDIYNKKINLKEGVEKIIALQPPSSILKKLSEMTNPQQKNIKTEKKEVTSKIDSILSMVEIPHDISAKKEEEVLSPFNLIINTITGNDNVSDSLSQKILSCKDYISKLIENISIIVLEQPFIRAFYSSWESLKTLLKIVGRKSEIVFYVYSATYDAAERNLSKILNYCAEEKSTPDFIIWDYPVTTDTATMEQLEYIGNIADRYKTIMLCSLYYNDELYKRLLNMEPLSSVLGENTFIPFRRLKSKDASRCLAFFAPDAISRKSSGITVRYSGAWLFSFLWASSYLESNTPFYLQYASSSGLFDGLIFPKISKDTLFDAYLHGLNLVAPEHPLTPRVIIDNPESPYGNLFFNMVVNRTARLTAEWISNQTSYEGDLSLQEYLKKELLANGILSKEEELHITTTDEEVVITVDSETKISNFNIKFEFSFRK